MFSPYECGAPSIGPESAEQVPCRLHKALIFSLLLLDFSNRGVDHPVKVHHFGGKIAESLPGFTTAIEQTLVAGAFLFVSPLEFRTNSLIITFDRRECFIGNAL